LSDFPTLNETVATVELKKVLVRHTEFSGPLDKQFGLPVMGNQYGVPTIADLRGAISPSAIGGLVMAVIVNAIKFRAFRGGSHISKEVLKPQPTLTYGNATTAVIAVCPVARVSAPRQHGTPRPVSSRGAHSMSALIKRALSPCHFSGAFFPIATAGLGAAAKKLMAQDRFDRAARTSAQPADVFPSGGDAKNHKVAERSAGEINHERHYSWSVA
jgi:hypothetical protein